MIKSKTKFGYISIAFGSVALILALLHFWAGPFTPAPTLETSIADKVSSIRTSTLKALKGEDYRVVTKPTWGADKIASIATALLGGITIILAVLAFVNKEPKRLVLGGAVLGGSAIAFQFLAMYLMALLVVLLIWVVLSSIGFEWW